MNKLLNYYYSLPYFNRGKLITLNKLNNKELLKILKKLKTEDENFRLNCLDKNIYINAVTYILNSRNSTDFYLKTIEINLVEKAYIKTDLILDKILFHYINTLKQYDKLPK